MQLITVDVTFGKGFHFSCFPVESKLPLAFSNESCLTAPCPQTTYRYLSDMKTNIPMLWPFRVGYTHSEGSHVTCDRKMPDGLTFPEFVCK